MVLVESPSIEWAEFPPPGPVGSFILDFVCHERMLVIEVDGGRHLKSKRDVERDSWLASKGYRVLRYWNSDVLQNREGVLQSILNAAQEATPLPNPPPQGGRELRRDRGEAR